MGALARSAPLRFGAAASVLLAALGTCTYAHAQETPSPPQTPPPALIDAERAEARGDHRLAESLYDQALAQDSGNTTALFGRARMRSWLGEFSAAIDDYRAGIARNPNDAQALSGLAWTYAWSHHFDEARRGFEHLAQIEPYYLDARKGLAYVALWRGQARDAREQFETLASEDRGNPDYVLAIGQAAYLQGDLPAARAAYEKALALKPGFDAARAGIASVDQAVIERKPAVMVLFGRSESGDASRSGLRYAQLSKQLTRNVRLWAIHDRGVGFDGFSPDRRAQDASTTTVGGFFNYTPRLAARIEAGVRDLPDETQPVLTGEQVFFLSGNTIPKLGFWWAHGDQNDQWVANASLFRRLSARFSLEPTVYFGNDGTTRETRGALLVTYSTTARMQFGLGVALGNKDTTGGNRSVDRVFANASVPLGKRATFLFYGWREDTEGFTHQTVLAAGVTAYL